MDMARNDLVRIVHMYYEENYTQQQIAEQLGCSRMAVSRYLRKARDMGVVRIDINYDGIFPDLERGMREKFGLRDVAIVPYENGPLLKKRLAQAAAGLLLRRLRPGNVVGVGWGSTLALIPDFLAHTPALGVTFVPLLGGYGQISNRMHANQIASRLGEVFRCKSYILNAPALVNNISLKESLMEDPSIKSTLDVARGADMALVGVGSPFAQESTLLDSGYYSPDDMEKLRASKIECNLLSMIYIDDKGHERSFDVADRNVGVTSDEYKKIPVKMAVAGGCGKLLAVYLAIRQKLVDVLVTDEKTTEFCLGMQ
ncbi:MAG: helix-turn-helix domain-containing protein [Synergistaceae bacterium]|jgi:DNA-binding transcriptional regulator LsrR (DeoR family)|nr:helix-turn-helix domain-containing protein [Synergistaceae bacterium]